MPPKVKKPSKTPEKPKPVAAQPKTDPAQAKKPTRKKRKNPTPNETQLKASLDISHISAAQSSTPLTKAAEIMPHSAKVSSLPSATDIENAFVNRDLDLLKTLLNQILSVHRDTDIITAKSREQLEKSESLIKDLVDENSELKSKLDSSSQIVDDKELKRVETENKRLLKQIETLSETSADLAESEKDELAKVQVILDMFELLGGLSCLDFEENDQQMIFTMKQSGPSVFLKFNLMISKSVDQGINEIVYTPLLKRDPSQSREEHEKYSRELKKTLPDYFLDSLTFPYSSLRSFHTKMSRSLSRSHEGDHTVEDI